MSQTAIKVLITGSYHVQGIDHNGYGTTNNVLINGSYLVQEKDDNGNDTDENEKGNE